MRRSPFLTFVLRRLRRLGLWRFLFWSFFLCIFLPVALVTYHVQTAVSPLEFLLKDMHEPKTVVVVPVPSVNGSLVVVDMMNVHQRLVERWLYVRYAGDRSDEELGYGLIWPKPGVAGIDRFNTSTWVSSQVAMPSGEMCNDIFILLKISNRTAYRRLAFGLNNGMLHSFHGTMMRDNGSMVTVEKSAELIDVCRRWFGLVENKKNKVVHAAYGKWIDKAERKNAVYDQIIIREREENAGNVVYYPNRVFSDVGKVRKLYRMMANNGFIIVYISRLDKSERENILDSYKASFGPHCTLFEPSKSQNNYLFCQKTSNSTHFEGIHRATFRPRVALRPIASSGASRRPAGTEQEYLASSASRTGRRPSFQVIVSRGMRSASTTAGFDQVPGSSMSTEGAEGAGRREVCLKLRTEWSPVVVSPMRSAGEHDSDEGGKEAKKSGTSRDVVDFRRPVLRILPAASPAAATVLQPKLMQQIPGWVSSGVKATKVVRKRCNEDGAFDIAWRTVLAAPVLYFATNENWTVLTCTDLTLNVLSTASGRVSFKLQLDSTAVQLGLQDSRAYVLTSEGYFSCWDLANQKALFAKIPMLELPSKNIRAHPISISPSGSPIISFSNGSTYKYDPDLQNWTSVNLLDSFSRLFDKKSINTSKKTMESTSKELTEGMTVEETPLNDAQSIEEQPMEEPMEPFEQPVDQPMEAPIEEPIEQLIEPSEQPSEQPSEPPVEPPVERQSVFSASLEPSTLKPFKHS